MKNFLIRYWKPLAFTVLGVAAGFAYWRFMGCKSGTCPITSNWHTSALAGGVFGFLISDMVKNNKKEKSA
jgi:hypothetical protein